MHVWLPARLGPEREVSATAERFFAAGGGVSESAPLDGPDLCIILTRTEGRLARDVRQEVD